MGKRQGMHYFCRIGAQKNHPEGWLRCGAADEARTRYLHLSLIHIYRHRLAAVVTLEKRRIRAVAVDAHVWVSFLEISKGSS